MGIDLYILKNNTWLGDSLLVIIRRFYALVIQYLIIISFKKREESEKNYVISIFNDMHGIDFSFLSIVWCKYFNLNTILKFIEISSVPPSANGCTVQSTILDFNIK